MTGRASSTQIAPTSAKPERASERFPSPLLDAKAAGARLSVPATWMLAEARADRIPHVRLGRYVRFDAEELEAWWRARVRGPRRRTGSGPVATGRESP